jgi:hypothetical protein
LKNFIVTDTKPLVLRILGVVHKERLSRGREVNKIVVYMGEEKINEERRLGGYKKGANFGFIDPAHLAANAMNSNQLE